MEYACRVRRARLGECRLGRVFASATKKIGLAVQSKKPRYNRDETRMTKVSRWLAAV